MAEPVTCPICWVEIADPTILSCGHSYCFKCLYDFCSSRTFQGVVEHACPTCRKEFLTCDLPRIRNPPNVYKRFTGDLEMSTIGCLGIMMVSILLFLGWVYSQPLVALVSCSTMVVGLSIRSTWVSLVLYAVMVYFCPTWVNLEVLMICLIVKLSWEVWGILDGLGNDYVKYNC